MSPKSDKKKKSQNDLIFTKSFELYLVFVCQNEQIFTKISALYQVAKCLNILKLYALKALFSKNWFYLFFLIF